MPFEEITHTADLSIRVWAADLPSLFSEAAMGMYWLAGVLPSLSPPKSRTLQLDASDPESLLVSFLSELVFVMEVEKLVFQDLAIQVNNNQLIVEMMGVPVSVVNKAIKAVTYHNLQIQNSANGLEVVLVFDV